MQFIQNINYNLLSVTGHFKYYRIEAEMVYAS